MPLLEERSAGEHATGEGECERGGERGRVWAVERCRGECPGLEAGLPEAGTAVGVGDSDDLDSRGEITIDQGEGKTAKKKSARAVRRRRPAMWSLGN